MKVSKFVAIIVQTETKALHFRTKTFFQGSVDGNEWKGTSIGVRSRMLADFGTNALFHG